MLPRFILLLIALLAALSQSQIVIGEEVIVLTLREHVEVSNNLLRLSDLVVFASDEFASTMVNAEHERLKQVVLSPAPMLGKTQLWTAKDIEVLLKLVGISIEPVAWHGASHCRVSRQTNIQQNTAHQSYIQPASFVNKLDFVAVSDKQNTKILAERNVTDAVNEYLQTRTHTHYDYLIEFDIPAAGLPFLLNRQNIVGVAGGAAPWIDAQRFQLQVSSKDESLIIEVAAHVKLPPLVYATVASLSRDHIVNQTDLQLIPLAKGSRIAADSCFSALEDLVGQQLSRAISSGQPIERKYVANPRIIEAYDAIEIQVHSGALVVSSSGRALQGGGMNDVIMVEVLPHRSKLAAQIVQAGIVRVGNK